MDGETGPTEGAQRVRGDLATRFGPGNQAARKKGRPKTGRLPQLLKDMRHVYTKEKDRTEGQRRCREFMRADQAGFIRQLAALEAKWAPPPKGGEADQAARPQEMDPGTRLATEALEEWLKKWGAGDGAT